MTDADRKRYEELAKFTEQLWLRQQQEKEKEDKKDQ